VNLDALIADLLGQPLDQFTPQRNAKVKALKASGQAEMAGELSTLKKPSVPLWAANQVKDPTLLAGLRSAAQTVVKAQAAAATGRSNAARDLRAASEEYQRKLDAVGNVAAAALRQGGHADSEEAQRRIREIFRLASLQGGGIWERLQKRALAVEPARADAELAQRATESARRRRQEATDAAAAAERAAERAAAAEDEAVRARAQAEKSQRAARQRKSR
jgi:hypothetical protein